MDYLLNDAHYEIFWASFVRILNLIINGLPSKRTKMKKKEVKGIGF